MERKKESIKWWQNSQCISLFNTFAYVRLNASQLTIIPQLSLVKRSQKTCEAPDFLQNSHIKTVSAQTYQLNTITVVLLWLIDTWYVMNTYYFVVSLLSSSEPSSVSLVSYIPNGIYKHWFSEIQVQFTQDKTNMHDLIFRMPKVPGVKRWLMTIIIFASFSSLVSNWELVWYVNSWAWRSWLWLNLSCGQNVNLLPCQIISVLEKKSLRKVLIGPPGLRGLGFDWIYWPMGGFLVDSAYLTLNPFSWCSTRDVNN